MLLQNILTVFDIISALCAILFFFSRLLKKNLALYPPYKYSLKERAVEGIMVGICNGVYILLGLSLLSLFCVCTVSFLPADIYYTIQ